MEFLDNPLHISAHLSTILLPGVMREEIPFEQLHNIMPGIAGGKSTLGEEADRFLFCTEIPSQLLVDVCLFVFIL